jgi:predicted Holliday junction resolvase-like endonuclease
MKDSELLAFFQLQRQIFGVCPNSGTIFRLSDCQIYVKKKPLPDWMQKIQAAQERIIKADDKLDEQEYEIMERARVEGRKQAAKTIRKIDTIFHPLKLNPDDSKVIFHPVDYIVFNGMKSGQMKNLIFLDKDKDSSDKRLQGSIRRTIENGKYEWVTLRVEDNGRIKEE